MNDLTSRSGRGRFLPLAVFAAYLAVQMLVRLLASTTLELDDAEQFDYAQAFALGYENQPPLYTWLVRAMSLLGGLNAVTILLTKYLIFSGFLFSFHALARRFWDERPAFLMTASLVVFPLYGYEFVRHQSHSVLVAFIAALTCLLFVRIVERKGVADYILIGAVSALGILSKYNYAFFLLAFLLSALLSPLRGAVLNRRILYSLAAFAAVLLPHCLWLVMEGFPSFRFAMDKARAGELPSYSFMKAVGMWMLPYWGAVIYGSLFLILFGGKKGEGAVSADWRRFFRGLAVLSLAIPLFSIIVLRAGYFSPAWLAPVLFTIPLALFSGRDVAASGARARILAVLCLILALGSIGARAVTGFFPDLTGKTERIHTPFVTLAAQLRERMEREGVSDAEGITVVSVQTFLGANIAAVLPGARFVPLQGLEKHPRKSGVFLFVWDATGKGTEPPGDLSRLGEPVSIFSLQAPYLHSARDRAFTMGFAVIRRPA